MATSSSKFDPFAFWTPERIEKTIRDATPAELPCATADYVHTGGPGPARMIRGPLGAMTMSGSKPKPGPTVLNVSAKSKLTAFPYQSIGRLYVYGSNTTMGRETVDLEVTKCATAFYVGNSELLTVAHVFKLHTGGVFFKETHGGIFIPAMINKEDKYGKNYGVYFVNPGDYRCHPRYDPDHDRLQEGMARHDVCRVNVVEGINRKGKMIGSIEDAKLQPLTVLTDYGESFSNQTTWRAFGYPCHHANEMLIGVRGEFSSKGTEVKMHTPAEVLEGMSGGPWMLESKGQVLGVQAGKLKDSTGAHFAVSPYLSADFLEK